MNSMNIIVTGGAGFIGSNFVFHNNREWWETIIFGEYQNYYEKMYGNRAEVQS